MGSKFLPNISVGVSSWFSAIVDRSKKYQIPVKNRGISDVQLKMKIFLIQLASQNLSQYWDLHRAQIFNQYLNRSTFMIFGKSRSFEKTVKYMLNISLFQTYNSKYFLMQLPNQNFSFSPKDMSGRAMYITAFGVGDISRIQGRFTAVRYIQILEEIFFPVSGKYFSFPPTVHGWCSIHPAIIFRQWFPPQFSNPLLPCGGLAIY